MTVTDWVRALPYEETLLMDQLLNELDILGVKL